VRAWVSTQSMVSYLRNFRAIIPGKDLKKSWEQF
jgi:hypothetical protein